MFGFVLNMTGLFPNKTGIVLKMKDLSQQQKICPKYYWIGHKYDRTCPIFDKNCPKYD